MQIDILTLFPQMFSALEHSIIKRARDNNLITINIIDFRKFSENRHKKVDDYSYSGGAGLVICAEPVVKAVESIDPNHESHRVFLTPSAPILTQLKVVELSAHKRLLLLCGHYEGVDERAIELCFDEVLSIGDYVLTGGEIPAMVFVDAVARHVKGVINSQSLENESFTLKNKNGSVLLEHPQYTRPREFRGLTVPDVLLNGNHAEIEKWKMEQSIARTNKFRPDLKA